jgi:hypothetical protein
LSHPGPAEETAVTAEERLSLLSAVVVGPGCFWRLNVPERRYYVETYDWELGRFTPQDGVGKGPYTLWGLRWALRLLQGMGYTARKGDPSVSVYSVDEPEIVERGK